MLNKTDPRTRHVLRAAVIEDEIRAHLTAVERGAGGAERASRFQDIVARVIPQLRLLNNTHFASSPGIMKHLDGIEDAATRQDVDLCWRRFRALADAPGDNFGTWAI